MCNYPLYCNNRRRKLANIGEPDTASNLIISFLKVAKDHFSTTGDKRNLACFKCIAKNEKNPRILCGFGTTPLVQLYMCLLKECFIYSFIPLRLSKVHSGW